MIKLLEGSIGEYLHNCHTGKNFLRQEQKALTIKNINESSLN